MNAYVQKEQKASSEKDKTGIPAQMKAKFERSSGFSFDDVRVHYNSEKPAQLHAHAYTQGSEVFVASGQEKHLPHELGHVVQQKSNAVKPTGEIGGMPLNDDEAMESGADKLAEVAENSEESDEEPAQAKAKDGGVVQMASGEGVYNWTAGLVSSLTDIAATGLAFGSFIYSKIDARKHRYIEEIEKYSDEACDASEEYIAQKELAGNKTSKKVENGKKPEEETEMKTAEQFEVKANARAEMSKLQAKVKRYGDSAVRKATAMGAFKSVDKSNKEEEEAKRKKESNLSEHSSSSEKSSSSSQPPKVNEMQSLTSNIFSSESQKSRDIDTVKTADINKIENENVKNALNRAKEAYDSCKDT